ncbi:SUMF1/EgtB/PvdO family nonheme iron enzyme [Candidatus Latescibacterota bacterium]
MMKKAAMAGILILTVFAITSCSDEETTSSRDTTLPQVQIQTPWDGSTREGIVDVFIEATDNAGIEKVEFYANNTLVGTVMTAPYELEWDLSGYSSGDISIYAKAYDINGNTRTTATWTVTKGPSTAPVATMTSPSAGWEVMQGYLTVLSGSATDLEDGTISDDNLVWSSDLQGTLGVGSSLQYRGFVLGKHVITMTAIDSDGNTNKKTVAITVTDNDQDFAYIQAGTYTIGPPLFAPQTVTFRKPFLISKTEVSIRDFNDNIDLEHTKLNKEKETTTNRYDFLDEGGYDSSLLTDTDTYGDYPAVFYTMHEFIVLCESLNNRDGFNESYTFYDNKNQLATKTSKYFKPIFMTRVDQSYDLNGWRLPTEAEWIVAASGGSAGRAYPWGDNVPAGRCNSLADPTSESIVQLSIGRGIAPVRSYENYRSPFGLYNMAGNVAEVCSDIYLPSLPQGIDPVGYTDAEEFECVVKGGAWYSRGEACQIGIRTMWIPYLGKSDLKTQKNLFDSGIGARIVRSLKPGEAPW